MSEYLQYGDIKLVNAPDAEAVADEVLKHDVYRIGTIPEGLTVIDVGAFHGEFAIACHKKGHDVYAFEPSPDNFSILQQNLRLNFLGYDFIGAFNVAVAGFNGMERIALNLKHPAGSKIETMRRGQMVWSVTMQNIIDAVDTYPFAVKLDCEGGEEWIFNDTEWLNATHWLSMEWHNCDGDKYAEILRQKNFTVEMSCDGTNSGGIIHARRKS